MRDDAERAVEHQLQSGAFHQHLVAEFRSRRERAGQFVGDAKMAFELSAENRLTGTDRQECLEIAHEFGELLLAIEIGVNCLDRARKRRPLDGFHSLCPCPYSYGKRSVPASTEPYNRINVSGRIKIQFCQKAFVKVSSIPVLE